MNIEELANMLKNSNIREVVQLAEGYLELKKQHEELIDRLFDTTSRLVMLQHHDTLKKLAD